MFGHLECAGLDTVTKNVVIDFLSFYAELDHGRQRGLITCEWQFQPPWEKAAAKWWPSAWWIRHWKGWWDHPAFEDESFPQPVRGFAQVERT